MSDVERYTREAWIQTDAGKDQEVLHRMRAAYEKSAPASASGSGSDYLKLLFDSRPARRVAAALILLGVAILLAKFGALLTGGNVAWADVTRRFQSVPFFSATIYMKDDATAEPIQMELWMSRDRHIRLRKGVQVVFAYSGQVEAYDIGSRRNVEPDEMARLFIEKIGQAQEFSLEAIIEVMFGGQTTEVTPLINPDAVISQDVVVFDVKLPSTPEWVRIWALRESRLPIRITVWDPRDGASTDAIFSYSREQPPAFFDPNAFETLLQGRSGGSQVNVVYAFLTDPGGRNVTPEDMFRASGYHVPVVKRAGMTEEGAFWVLAGEALNQMANGTIFHGFSRIEDDLDRSYVNVGSYYRGKDESLDVFVPIDFPFDGRRPSKVTLVCDSAGGRPERSPQVVGIVELGVWEPNAPCPEFHQGIDTSLVSLEIDLARRLVTAQHAGRLNRLLQVIPSWTEQSNDVSVLLFWREMTFRRKDFRQTVEIGQVLTPLLLASPQRASRHHFTEYIVALAATGRLDDAKALFQRVNAIDDISPRQSDTRYYNTYLLRVIQSLARNADLTIEQINAVFGFDIGRRDEYVRAAEQGRRDASFDRTSHDAEQRLKEIAAYYQTHSLPEKAELLQRPDDRRIFLAGVPNTLPGHEGYRVQPLNGSINDIISRLRAMGAGTREAGKVHPYASAIRFAEGLQDRELRADLVYRDGIELSERFRLVFAACGMELTTETLPGPVDSGCPL